jgi:hypothetical protein
VSSFAPVRRENADISIVKQMNRMAGIVFFMPRLANTMLITAKSFELFFRRARARLRSGNLKDFVAIARKLGGMKVESKGSKGSHQSFVYFSVFVCIRDALAPRQGATARPIPPTPPVKRAPSTTFFKSRDHPQRWHR